MAKKNPPWTRDELVLALHLYIRSGRRVLPETDAQVVRLSTVLNRLPLHSDRDAKFRNPNGVAMKLANFRRIDPQGGSKGLRGGNALEPVVWAEFASDEVRLHAVAESIIAASTDIESTDLIDEQEDDFPEGRILYRMHRTRERSGAAVALRKANGGPRPKCEVCRFDFFDSYGELGSGYIECHHTRPVSMLRPEARTSVRDLALVCSNCHRMLHRRRPWLSMEDLANLVNRNRESER